MALALKTRCPETGKERYRSELDAKIMLANVQQKAAKHRKSRYREIPRGYYRCPDCGYWELTSRSDRHLKLVKS